MTYGSSDFTGKTVEDAIAEGLRRLGLQADAVEIDVISKGSRGLFGLGSEPALVRITPRPRTPAIQPPAPVEPVAPAAAVAPVASAQPQSEDVTKASDAALDAAPTTASAVDVTPRAVVADTTAEPSTDEGDSKETTAGRPVQSDEQIAQMASDMLETMTRLMGFTTQISAEWRDGDAITDERHLLLNIEGDQVGTLIGRRGETLENMQYLLRLMVNQKLHRWLNIIIDVEQYKSKRVEHLSQLATRMADQVTSSGRAFTLEPMPPNERRIIHLALRDHPHVYTESTGEGERRKVTIVAKK